VELDVVAGEVILVLMMDAVDMGAPLETVIDEIVVIDAGLGEYFDES
jgi:hypothetical protein